MSAWDPKPIVIKVKFEHARLMSQVMIEASLAKQLLHEGYIWEAYDRAITEASENMSIVVPIHKQDEFAVKSVGVDLSKIDTKTMADGSAYVYMTPQGAQEFVNAAMNYGGQNANSRLTTALKSIGQAVMKKIGMPGVFKFKGPDVEELSYERPQITEPDPDMERAQFARGDPPPQDLMPQDQFDKIYASGQDPTQQQQQFSKTGGINAPAEEPSIPSDVESLTQMMNAMPSSAKEPEELEVPGYTPPESIPELPDSNIENLPDFKASTREVPTASGDLEDPTKWASELTSDTSHLQPASDDAESARARGVLSNPSQQQIARDAQHLRGSSGRQVDITGKLIDQKAAAENEEENPLNWDLTEAYRFLGISNNESKELMREWKYWLTGGA